MIRISKMAPRAAVFALVAATVLLAGCNSYDVKTQQQIKAMSTKFNTVVAAYKKQQFTLDGAVLSSADLGSHFAYLKDQGKLPTRVLLVPSEKSSIHKEHLAYLLRMGLNDGFKVYYDNDGVLTRVTPENTAAAKRLKQTTPDNGNSHADKEVESHDASHGVYSSPVDGGNGG